ncbi:hypothetical protein JW897_12215 [Chromobacterium alkanivorans]|uniref:hypothetical protein n=1 Tax=Chromobacterium alkanivorans TaxID=1071719 RepID=UPI00196791CB|nr:hypothetical protein [Chromobacterium alkanivorans]MBN3004500.1 hypothetical protein [Chromobacterium alkanivorans]
MNRQRVVQIEAAGAARGVDPFQQLAAYVLGRLTGMWPDKITKCLPDSKLVRLFTQELEAALAQRRIGRDLVDAGLEQIRAECDWPPVEVPKLLRYFSPVRDYQAAFEEAQRLSWECEYGNPVPPQAWSHPAVYWAAERFGWFEARNASWDQARKRWVVVLDEVLTWGHWPDAMARLPDAGGLRTEGAHLSAMAKARELLTGAADRRDQVTSARIRDMQERGLWRRDDGVVT